MPIVYLHVGCPQRPIDSIISGLGISGAVVIVGLFLIFFWKTLSFIYDTNEYSRYKAVIRDPIWEKVKGGGVKLRFCKKLNTIIITFIL